MEARLKSALRALAFLLAAALLPPGTAMGATAAQRHFAAAVEHAKTSMLADPRRALADVDEAASIAAAAPDDAERERMGATVLWLKGEAYARDNEPERALALLQQARQLADRIAPGSALDADILLALGSALTDSGQVTDALATLQRAHLMFRALDDPRSQAKALILIAMLYSSARDHAAALRYFGQAIDAHAADPGLAIAIYMGRGSVFVTLGRFRDAEADFARADALAIRLGTRSARALALGNLARAQIQAGELRAADASITTGLHLTRHPDGAMWRGFMLQVAAASAFRHHDLPRAAAYLSERFRDIDLTKTNLTDRDAHEIAYQTYSAMGDTTRAIAHLKALKRLDDQATEVARSSSAALASARFDYANQELRIAKLKAADLQKSVAFERAAARTQRLVFIGAAAATLTIIVMLGIALIVIRRSRDQVRAANADLAESNVALGKALAAKTEFLATTSHEIRTPLNGILGMTQVMIADAATDAVARDRLSVIQGAGVTMRALVDDILDVAKIETGRMTIEAAPMDLSATIDDASRMWREQARSKGLAFALDLEACPTWIVGDAARLRQIVFNLLSNAVKFTPAGHVSVRCAADGDRLSLTVSDTGIGIAEEAHEIIFESFRQADAGTTRQFGGTGLGLSICRNLARAMGGDVTVASTPDRGATFTVNLPFVVAEAPETVASDIAVLIVEANPINRAMYKSLFAAEGEVALASDMADAVAQLGRCYPRRVLVDRAALPNGTESLAELVTMARDVPVILLSQALTPDERAAWIAVGAADLIERPIGKKALVDRVRTVDSALVKCAA